jgi:hypothetical protein
MAAATVEMGAMAPPQVVLQAAEAAALGDIRALAEKVVTHAPPVLLEIVDRAVALAVVEVGIAAVQRVFKAAVVEAVSAYWVKAAMALAV